jgi:hypothetical protein
MPISRRKAIASIVGTMIFVLVLMLAMGAQAYMSGLQAVSGQSYGEAQQAAYRKGMESLTFGASSSGLVAINGGPATSEVIGMYFRDPNGSVYYGPSFQPAFLPPGGEAAVRGLVPGGVCLPTGTTTCLGRYTEAARQAAAGFGVGLLTSLGNTFWYESGSGAPGNLTLYYATLGATYIDSGLASVGCGLTLATVPSGTVKVEASVGVLGTGSFQTYVYIYRSTAGIPPRGGAPGGSDARIGQCFLSGTATGAACSFDLVDGGLSPSTTYYYYMAAASSGSFPAEILGGSPVQTSITAEPL